MAENDAKKKGKMIGYATDHHQKEGDSDDSVNQADPGYSSIMKEEDAKNENLKKMSSISYHLQKYGGDHSSRLALKNEGDPSDGDATKLVNVIISTPKKRKEPTTTAETPSKKRKEERRTPSKTATAQTVKRFPKMNVKVPKKESSAAGNNSSDSDASSILLIKGKGCSSPTSGLLPKAPPETDGKN
ncbi:hypothetical protein QL285_017417 [Trifolium repens]|nr:hypothetical protein QL285_017417 [Trifolium repens]